MSLPPCCCAQERQGRRRESATTGGRWRSWLSSEPAPAVGRAAGGRRMQANRCRGFHEAATWSGMAGLGRKRGLCKARASRWVGMIYSRFHEPHVLRKADCRPPHQRRADSMLINVRAARGGLGLAWCYALCPRPTQAKGRAFSAPTSGPAQPVASPGRPGSAGARTARGAGCVVVACGSEAGVRSQQRLFRAQEEEEQGSSSNPPVSLNQTTQAICAMPPWRQQPHSTDVRFSR